MDIKYAKQAQECESKKLAEEEIQKVRQEAEEQIQKVRQEAIMDIKHAKNAQERDQKKIFIDSRCIWKYRNGNIQFENDKYTIFVE